MASYSGYDNVIAVSKVGININCPSLLDLIDHNYLDFQYLGSGVCSWLTQGTHILLTRRYSTLIDANANISIRERCNVPANVNIVRSAVYINNITYNTGNDGSLVTLTINFRCTCYGDDNKQYNMTNPQIDYHKTTLIGLGREVSSGGVWKEEIAASENIQVQKVADFYIQPYYTSADVQYAQVDIDFSLPVFKTSAEATNYVKTGAGSPIQPVEPTNLKKYYLNCTCYKSLDGTKNKKRLVYEHVQEFLVNEECTMIRYVVKGGVTRYDMFTNYKVLDNNVFNGTEKYVEYNEDGTVASRGERKDLTNMLQMFNPYAVGENINNGGFFGVIDSNIPLRNNKNDFPEDGEGGGDGGGGGNPTGDEEDGTVTPNPDVQLPLSMVYTMTFEQMNALADEIYTNDTTKLTNILDGLKMYGENPINFFIDAYYIPFDVSAFSDRVNAIAIPFGSYIAELTAKRVTHNNKKYVMCNTIIGGSFGDFRDYLCTYTLYLPYIGIVEMDYLKYLNRMLKIECTFDVRTGNIKYYLYSSGVLSDMYEGSVRVSMPLTGADKSARAMDTIHAVEGVINSGADAVVGGISKIGDLSGVAKSFEGAFDNLLKGYQKHITGNASPSNAIFDCMYPYVIIEIPDFIVPANLHDKYGYPDNDVNTIGTRSGYLECTNVRLTSSATDTEKSEILTLLQSGVIV